MTAVQDLPVASNADGRHRNLLPGEDVTAYDRLRADLVDRYAPQSILEEMELEQLLATIWDIMRLVRLKPQVLNIDRKRALADLIRTLLFSSSAFRVQDIDEADRMAAAYFTDESMKSEIDSLLAHHGLNGDSITAKAFAFNTETLQAIEQQITLASGRAYVMHGRLQEFAEQNGRVPIRKRVAKAIAAPTS